MRCFALPISLSWLVWNSFDHRDRCFMYTRLYCFILPLGIIDLSGFVNRHRAQTTIKIIIIIWQLPGAHFRVSSTMNFNDVDSVVVLHRKMAQKTYSCHERIWECCHTVPWFYLNINSRTSAPGLPHKGDENLQRFSVRYSCHVHLNYGIICLEPNGSFSITVIIYAHRSHRPTLNTWRTWSKNNLIFFHPTIHKNDTVHLHIYSICGVIKMKCPDFLP